MFKDFKPIAKFVVPVLGAIVYAVQAALSDSNVSTEEWKGIVAAALVAILVYLVPNKTAEASKPVESEVPPTSGFEDLT